MTKEEKKLYLKEYREKNKDKIKNKRKEYRDNNKDKIKEYRDNNKDKIKEYRDNNKDKIKEYRKEYYIKNKDKIKENKKKYYETNKEKIKEYEITNREKRKNNLKIYRDNNKVELKEYRKEYYIKNKDKIKEYCDNNKEKRKIYREEHKEIANQRSKNRRLNDPIYRISGNLRTLIRFHLLNKGYQKNSRTHEILGCSFEEFKQHIESKFESWMNWDNYGLYNGKLNYGWDIDHIKPLSSAENEEGVIALNHYTNLQPLCSKINRHIKKNII